MIDSKRFIKQLIGYFPSQIIPALSSLGIILILTRYMSVENYGYYSLLITTANIIVTIVTQWIMQSILFFRPKYKTNYRIEEFDGLILRIYALLTSITAFLLLILVSMALITQLQLQIIIPVLLIILFNSIFVINQTILQSDMKVAKYSLQISLSTILKLILITMVAVYFESDLSLILWVTVLSYILFVIPEFYGIINEIRVKDNTQISLKEFLLEMLQFGFPMLGWFLATSLITITDRYLLAIFESTYEVGLYAANVAIVSSALSLVFAPFIKVIHPIIMNSASEDKIEKIAISKLMTKFSLLFTMLGIPVITVILVLRQEISELLLGIKYVEGSIIIPFILIGIFFWNLAMIGHKGFEVNRDTKPMFFYVLVACILNIVLNFIFIPMLGILGAGIASLIAYVSYLVLIKINSKKNIYWVLPWKPIFILIIFGVTTYLVSSFLSSNIIYPNIIVHILSIGIFVLIIYTVLCYFGIKFFGKKRLLLM
ncbi:hypothetical protein HMPREF1210_01699 [Paenisporosarcina sp. HGH0030]|uniref:oligosaccharide flippase family protein n=1 Tax=Paenisporosarcina sp. HGH0030 TaxID=1078085 RepID=UPI00034E877E|nr:oligosaccharide flippase family protein [Paenisporosarcina sp. HGH0030]EPD52346.1 hypothetical protein HMPREF1210_01699 [Paenisporosarcina sp. HGH0030]